MLGTSIYGARVVGVNGTYDDVNRLCSEIAGKYGWGVRQRQPAPVLRRGLEELRLRDRRAARLARCRRTSWCRWRAARWSPRSARRSSELDEAGAGAGAGARPGIHGAQAAGCAPIVETVLEDRDAIRPVKKPTTHRQVAGHRQPGRRASTRARRSSARAAGRPPSDDEIVDGDAACWPRPRGSSPRPPAASRWARRSKLIAEGQHRQGRRADRHLRHRQRHEDAGAAGRRAARAGADRPAPRTTSTKVLQATWT